MLDIAGYTAFERVEVTPFAKTFRARRVHDGLPVVLQSLSIGRARSAEIARFKHEYAQLVQLSSQSLVSVLGVEAREDSLVVIREHFPGQTLAHTLAARPGNKLPVSEALAIATAIAEALAALHGRGITHRDVRPQNILVGDAGALKLTGSGVDAEVTRAHERLYAYEVLHDVLPYTAPEQTGRMNRSVDHRADLYALGIILYEALTGRRPFEAREPMELIHAHLALQAKPPAHIDSSVPETLSRLILKLLEKNAEDRYQSAEGLLVDLRRCSHELKTLGTISLFTPAEHDHEGGLRIHQKLYGRERDIDALTSTFTRSLGGERSIVLVSGYSGIGKSALVHEILKPLARAKGYYTSGKFDQFNRDTPYSAVIQAFDGLVRQILTESTERIQAWQRAWLEALGQNGQVICDVLPSMAHVLGPQPVVPALGPVEAQNRLSRCFVQFVSVVARRAHPLVFFLDDLQWIDLASLDLLRALLADDSLESFFFCGAYRDNEVSPAHPFIAALEEHKRAGLSVCDIVLGPLERRHIVDMLSDSLRRSDTGPLADAILKKTAGNPFFVRRFLHSLGDHGVLTFKPGTGFYWDLKRLDELAYSENVVDLMVRTIARLPKTTQEALRLAAAIGSEFDLGVLATVLECTHEQAYGRLEPAAAEGLIIPGRSGYRFAHDKVQEGAYAMIPVAGRPAFHLRIGRLLAESTPLSESRNLFDVVGHLNSALELIDDPHERETLARMNLVAATRAEESAAFGAARSFLELGLQCLPEDAWTSKHQLRLAYARKLGVTLSLLGHHDDALAALGEALERATTRLARTEILRLKMKAQVLKNDLPAALAEGLVVMHSFGLDLPAFPDEATLEEQMRVTLDLVVERSPEALLNLPPLEDPEIAALLEVLEELFAPTYFLATNNFSISIAKILELSYRHGLSRSTTYGCINFGMLLCVRGHIKLGYELGRIAVRLGEKLGDKKNEAMIRNMWGGFVQYWGDGYSACWDTLIRGKDAGLETGQYIWSFYNTVNAVTNSFMRGLPIEDIIAEAKSYQPIRKLDRFDAITWMAGAAGQIAYNLSVETDDPCRLVGPLVDIEEVMAACRRIKNESAFFFAQLYIVFLLVFQGAFEEAARVVLESNPELVSIAVWHGTPVFRAYAALALTRASTSAAPEERAVMLSRAAAYAEKLDAWAEICPENFAPRAALVRAELARARGEDRFVTAELYDTAISLAHRGGYIHDEALANELCARHWMDAGKTTLARAHLSEARRLYARWGATVASRRLARAYPELVARDETFDAPLPSTPAPSADALDIGSVLKAAQAISGEIALPRLIDALLRVALENAGARRGVLLLLRDGSLVVEAEQRAFGEEDAPASTAIERDLGQRSDLPATVLAYVARTRESVLLEDRALDGPFGRDPYLVDAPPRSALAAPIIGKGRLSGVIYLENDLARGAFTPARVEVVGLICTQAAIAIENARLYGELERQVEERTAELRHANEALVRLSRAEQERREQEALDQRAVISQQEEVIHALSAPIIEVWYGVIAVPLVGVLDARRGEEIMERVLHRIGSASCRQVILDLTGVESVDSETGERIMRIVGATRLLGASVVITGIRAAVAQTMVAFDAGLKELTTRATLRDALRAYMRSEGAGGFSTRR
ncbi:AAA family ATPase [Polyangium jinanense]|uniref:AAA family ATPase n=1 Tax=Polyangium jinanense TaxID=2829994 RepID=A0A9X3X9Y7_9BACT|nr:AAA family ATPase [Polyangium jinanense]MDC3954357.1 AAA family ATPase [Polyangium jinanense]MDC3984191.1 AAA family ATPase [Polyangium jinanense]